MNALEIAATAWVSVCAFILLILHIKSHKITKSLFFNALLGISAVILINITRKFTGVHIPINWWTLGGGGIFGIPCVCAVVLAQIII